MNRYLFIMFFGSLLFIEYRWGMTPNRFFVVTFLFSATISAYHALWLIGSALIKLKSSKLLLHPTPYYRRKLFICVMITSVAFYGFYRTKIPGQLEYYRILIEREFEELTRKEESPKVEQDSYPRLATSRKREKLVSETALNASKIDERKIDSKEILKEITMGWNTATADTENDNVNWERATDLMKKYPNYIQNAKEHDIRAAKALEEPWEYYGKIVHFKGQVYGVQQLPPDNSVAQFFDGSCYHTMLAVKDKKTPVIVSAYIIGNSESVAENSVINVKGFIYGQSTLVNSTGGVSKGLAFIGFRE